MRSNVYLLAISIILILSIGLNIYLFKSLDKVQKQFDEQSKIIKKYDEIDKRLKSGESDLLDLLEKFIDENGFTVGNKSVSNGDFLLYHKKISDSLDNYKWMYDAAKNEYGFNLWVTYDKDTNVKTLHYDRNSKADSASVLLDVYRDLLYKKNGVWHIQSNYKKEYEELKKMHDKTVRQTEENNKKIRKWAEEIKNLDSIRNKTKD